ncbi:MAG: hypothetical protein JWR50_3027, partial [Mucilaginibacter sp.]|nr:hypothetical protein [Mucilaginibacter sp.]
MIRPFSSIILRSPLQSLKLAYDFSQDMKTLFREGLYLSSPEFWQEYQKIEHLSEKEKAKLDLSFSKYWIRSCSRCTPYGTFAGTNLLQIEDGETEIELNDPFQYIRSVRLDMNYVTKIISSLIKTPLIQNQIKYFANDSLYELADSFRYAEYFIKDNMRSYDLTAINKTPYIQSILEQAKNGVKIESLVKILTNLEDVSEEQAREFVVEMCDSQLLIPDLEPCITGKEPLAQLIDHFENLSGVEEISIQFKKIQSLINNPKHGIEYYKDIELELKNLKFPVEIPKNTLQTDLYLSLKRNKISNEVIKAIVAQSEDLYSLSRLSKNRDLDTFKEKFNLKYEQQEVPLFLVLDSELGIGYAGIDQSSSGDGPLIEDIIIRKSVSSNAFEPDYINQFTFKKYNDYVKNGDNFIEITNDELDSFKPIVANYKFSSSLHLVGSLMRQNGMLNAENFVFDVSGLGGTSAGNLLARFTHGDKELYDFTRTILEEEEKECPDMLYAEIVHLPQARIGNVILRPILRNYEIPYIGRSGLDKEKQIQIDDLVVSLRNNKILLRSKKHDKYIIPRLTTAHNFTHKSLPVYKFLCDLQSQDLAHPNVWDWGMLSSLNHLPRVIYKNLIIKKALWKIEEKKLINLPKEDREYLQYFKEFRESLNMPPRVLYIEADNKLLIDFENIDGIKLFLHYLKRHKIIQLEECLATEENCIVFDANGNPYANELIIPLIREKDRYTPIGDKKVPPFTVRRKFSPYSEWLYFKIYCGPTVAEKIL